MWSMLDSSRCASAVGRSILLASAANPLCRAPTPSSKIKVGPRLHLSCFAGTRTERFFGACRAFDRAPLNAPMILLVQSSSPPLWLSPSPHLPSSPSQAPSVEPLTPGQFASIRWLSRGHRASVTLSVATLTHPVVVCQPACSRLHLDCVQRFGAYRHRHIGGHEGVVKC